PAAVAVARAPRAPSSAPAIARATVHAPRPRSTRASCHASPAGDGRRTTEKPRHTSATQRSATVSASPSSHASPGPLPSQPPVGGTQPGIGSKRHTPPTQVSLVHGSSSSHGIGAPVHSPPPHVSPVVHGSP